MRMLTILLFVSYGITPAHIGPYVTFVCRFTDNRGNPLNNHFVVLKTAGSGWQAKIVNGEARVNILFKRDYSGLLNLKVYDKRRKPVELVLCSGEKVKELVYEFSHVLGSGLRNNSEFGNLLEDGMQYVSEAVLSSKPELLQSLAINWNWSMVSENEKKEVEFHRLIDEKNLAEFKKRLAEIRRKKKEFCD